MAESATTPAAGKQRMRTVVFSNQKGGVGKSTIAANVAYHLARQGYRVLAVDMDPQGNLTGGFGISAEDEYAVSDVLRGRCEVSDAIQTSCGVDVVPSDIELASYELELNGMMFLREHQLKELLVAKVASDYDFCIVDCPPSLNLLLVNALIAADYVVVPMEPSAESLKAFSTLAEKSIRSTQILNPSLRVLGLVFNRFRSNTNAAKANLDKGRELAAANGTKVYDRTVREATVVANAHSAGVPVCAYQPNCPVSAELTELAQAILEDILKIERGE